jgi:hypothetical protein
MLISKNLINLRHSTFQLVRVWQKVKFLPLSPRISRLLSSPFTSMPPNQRAKPQTISLTKLILQLGQMTRGDTLGKVDIISAQNFKSNIFGGLAGGKLSNKKCRRNNNQTLFLFSLRCISKLNPVKSRFL